MLDPKCYRNALTETATQLKRRGFTLETNVFVQLEEQRKTLHEQTQALQTQRNQLSKAIGQLKAAGDEAAATAKMVQVSEIGDQLKSAQTALHQVQETLLQRQLEVPNVLDSTVPDGRDEQDNVEQRRWGEIKPVESTHLDHLTYGEQRGWLDPESAAKLSGSRFMVIRGPLARLHRALTQFMLDVHSEQHGYQECYVPYLVNLDCLYGTGQLPKLREDFFVTACNHQDQHEMALIPTAEVPLTNLVRDCIVSADELPLRLMAHTPCFRREAGAYGKDTRGMIRNHQFEKVELVQVTRAEQADEALETLTGHAERILQLLALPYRVVLLCAGDTGFSAMKTYDLEVWLPSQQAYREISSCSHFGTFQARRLKARWKNKHDPKAKPQWVHTLNGSGLAVGRTLIAVIEHYQTPDGQLRIPDVLQPYMGGQTVI